MELIKQIKETEEKLANLRLELEKQNQTKLDYSKWVGIYKSPFIKCLAIKGDKLLKTYEDEDLAYSNINRKDYDNKVDYEVVNMSDLKVGDLVIKDDIEFKDTNLSDFEIFRGDYYGDYFFNYLTNTCNVEIIDKNMYCKDSKVKRFLRK